MVDGLAANQVGHAWNLESFDPALTKRVLLGDIVFTIPATALAGQSYRVRFGNADGAPDENTQYEFESFSGKVWVAAPESGSPDPISDEWKIKFFGSVDSPNAAPDADPDKDGSPNWQEFLAGTDPTDAKSHLHLRGPVQHSNKGKKEVAMHWLSAPGKHYVIETTTDLQKPAWTPVVLDVAGDGNEQEFLDANPSQTTQYYRVRLQQ